MRNSWGRRAFAADEIPASAYVWLSFVQSHHGNRKGKTVFLAWMRSKSPHLRYYVAAAFERHQLRHSTCWTSKCHPSGALARLGLRNIQTRSEWTSILCNLCRYVGPWYVLIKLTWQSFLLLFNIFTFSWFEEAFLALMGRKRLCVLRFLGPSGGTLRLMPKKDEAEAIKDVSGEETGDMLRTREEFFLSSWLLAW